MGWGTDSVCKVMYACMPFSSVGVAFELISVPVLVMRRKAMTGVGEVVRCEKRVMRSKSFGYCGVWSEEGVRRRKRNWW